MTFVVNLSLKWDMSNNPFYLCLSVCENTNYVAIKNHSFVKAMPSITQRTLF